MGLSETHRHRRRRTEARERRRQDKSSEAQPKKRNMCSKNSTMLVLCAILLVLPKAEAIKFSAEGGSVPDGVLRVDEPTELGCKYNMRLTDGGEDEVVICCDVKVLRDDGYGSMTTKHKEKCSAPIRVEDQSRSRHNLVSISADVPETGSVGETVPIVCNA